jgi:UDP-N-acetylmuramoylalanine--D-glutamate ligase
VVLPADKAFTPYAQSAAGEVIRVGKKTDAARLLVEKTKVKLLGEHNKQNAAFAVALCQRLRVRASAIKSVLTTFAGLPNRLEEIANKNGVRYINDTTSTTPDATIAALEAFASSPIHLIFGGADKELEFEEVVSVIKRVKPRIYLLPGTAHEKIKKVFTRAKISWIEVSDLAEVFAHLKHQTKKGDIVLLSPGCASFGLFKNEFDRGDTFRRLVHSL